MTDTTFPAKVYYKRPDGTFKELTVKSQAEMDRFLAIGWVQSK